jgi:1,4-dihydroxy-2-naphthoyl-CoA hydrolase
MIPTTITLEQIEKLCKNNLLEHLDIKIDKFGENFIEATMPVDYRTIQPAGLLHGGATAALIESLGSIGSALAVHHLNQNIVGIEINVNHLRGVKSGRVRGRAEIIHAGKTTHVWQVNVTDEQDKLVATGRLTVLIIEKRDH